MVSKRQERKQRQRKRRRKTIFSVLLILFLSVVIFSIYQYWAGKNAAEEVINKDPETTEKEKGWENSFNGDEQKFDDSINVLLLGEDSSQQGVSRTDTIMIGQYDAENDRAKLVSIMRDTYVKIPEYGYNKINAAFAYGGPELLRKTIKENFGIEIHNYAIVDFRGFEHIVDTIAPDGIKIDVEKRMYYYDNAGDVSINLQEGVQRLDGETLLDYARFRHDAESDFGRVRRQQQVMRALKDQMLSFTSLIKVPKAVGTLIPYISTDMEKTKILKFATHFFLDTPPEIETMRIPRDGTFSNKTYENAGAVLSINLRKNKNAFQEFFKIQPKEDDETQQEPTTESNQDE